MVALPPLEFPCLRFFPLLASAAAFSSARAAADATPARLGSTVFAWENLAVHPTPVGERREVARHPTATFREFACHVSTLNPGRASHPPHTHPEEELIILRDGELEVFLNGVTTRVGPGALLFFASNDAHSVRNAGDKPATHFVFRFATAITASLRGTAPLPGAPGRPGSAVFPWEKLPVRPTKTGEFRPVLDAPTSTFVNFECHVTTLRPGLPPHPPHRHPDEEILLLQEGELEVTINGATTHATPGSVVFVSSRDEHGWRNVGAMNAVYYVIRIITDATPATAAP